MENSGRIDELIEKAKSMVPNAKGGNKKCFLIGNNALLKTNGINEEELKRVMDIEIELKKKGVNLVQTLEYQIYSEDIGTAKEYKRGYILQEKANGEPLHKTENILKMTSAQRSEVEAEYVNRLRELQNEQGEFYDKFVSDWIEISKAGLMVDPSKTSNFYYEKGKQVNFIDLNIDRRFNGTVDLNTKSFEMAVVLADGIKYYNSNLQTNPNTRQNANEALAVIFKKLTDSLVKAGMDKDRLKTILAERFPEVELEEPKKGISGQLLKKGIRQSRVTISEEQSAIEDMKRLTEIKRLMFDKKNGKQLTEEQEMLIQSHIRQTNEAQARFQNQQHREENKLIKE